jgi:hypothetical protein
MVMQLQYLSVSLQFNSQTFMVSRLQGSVFVEWFRGIFTLPSFNQFLLITRTNTAQSLLFRQNLHKLCIANNDI